MGIEREWRDLHSTADKKPSASNLIHAQQALKELKNMENIVIKISDKGGSVVVLNRIDYLLMQNYNLIQLKICSKKWINC